ncbi:hypothetical protein, partial [Caballeronia sp. INML2]|uniref:hypothetical protein n=1 Tax=Caballeronia sp. INML2 TaxID=2921748 RepID=UPI002029083C
VAGHYGRLTPQLFHSRNCPNSRSHLFSHIAGSVLFTRPLWRIDCHFGVEDSSQLLEADIQLYCIADDSKATCSGRTSAERRASAKAESNLRFTAEPRPTQRREDFGQSRLSPFIRRAAAARGRRQLAWPVVDVCFGRW